MSKLNSHKITVVQWIQRNIVFLSIGFVAIYVITLDFSNKYWNHEDMVIEWDIKSYYAYLPATFIYKDLSLDFIESDPKKFKKNIWPVNTPTGKKAIVTSMGLSILYSPFFLVAHLITPFTDYEADGYTMPYKLALMMSCFVYLLIGLFFLKKILEKYFNKYITAITLLSIGLGTNLLVYTTFHDAPMSHVYNFALINIFLYYVIKWHENPNYRITIILGIIAGLIALIRPTNILILLILFFYNIQSIKELGQKVLFFLNNYKKVLAMAGFFILVWVPQFLYWKYVSGSFLYYSYGELGGVFFFDNPQFFNFLFSYKKGWLLYTPIMIFALMGIPVLFYRMKQFFLPVLIYLLVVIYVLSSWWSWWFGGGFGARSLIDLYGVMAIPIAAFLNFCFSRKRIVGFSIVFAFFVLIGLNLFQSRQYSRGTIHYAWMTKEAYWHTFLKPYPDSEFWGMLRKYDHQLAKQGIYKEVKPDFKTYTKEERIKQIENHIWKNEDMLEQVKQKAYNRGIELDSMIKLDATWIYNKQYKVKEEN